MNNNAKKDSVEGNPSVEIIEVNVPTSTTM
jgi:hypothetical protein